MCIPSRVKPGGGGKSASESEFSAGIGS